MEQLNFADKKYRDTLTRSYQTFEENANDIQRYFCYISIDEIVDMHEQGWSDEVIDFFERANVQDEYKKKIALNMHDICKYGLQCWIEIKKKK